MIGNKWTQDMKLTIKELWEEGHFVSQIATLMKKKYGLSISKNAAVGAIHRLHLNPRSNPVNRIYEKKPPEKKPAQAPPKAAPAHKTFPQEIVRRDRCQWPLWKYERPTHLYCGAKVNLGSSYCQDHRSIAYKRNY